MKLVGDFSFGPDIPIAFDPSEICVGSEPFGFYHRHCSKEVARRLGESVIHIEDPLFKVFLVSEFYSSLEVEAKFSVREETRPALDFPVGVVYEVFRLFAFAWSKVKVCSLVSVVVQEYLGVTIDQSAVLAVVEVFPPHWVILDVVFLLFQCPLHVVFVTFFL